MSLAYTRSSQHAGWPIVEEGPRPLGRVRVGAAQPTASSGRWRLPPPPELARSAPRVAPAAPAPAGYEGAGAAGYEGAGAAGCPAHKVLRPTAPAEDGLVRSIQSRYRDEVRQCAAMALMRPPRGGIYRALRVRSRRGRQGTRSPLPGGGGLRAAASGVRAAASGAESVGSRRDLCHPVPLTGPG